MGRTIHFDIKKSSAFIDEEYRKAYDISNKYNSGIFKDVWTCENFWWDGYDYYPSTDSNWDKVSDRYKDIEAEGKHHIDIVKQLKEEGIVNFLQEPGTNIGHGFVKVQGNEYNSFLVLSALIDLSKAIPEADISVHDEGEFLLCDITLVDGKVKIDLEEIAKNIKHWSFIIAQKNTEFREESLNKYPGIPGQLLKDLGFNTPYDTKLAVEYLEDELRNLSEICDRLKEEGSIDHNFFIYNLEQREFDPFLFTRSVKAEDFKYYGSSIVSLMDGFSGEGFGLKDTDKELLAYQTLSVIQKLIPEDSTIKILGVDR